jgi:hypothetical protein
MTASRCLTTSNRPISVYRSPRLALTLCLQLCMGNQPGARFPARALTICLQLCMGISLRRYTEIGPLPFASQSRE